MVSRWSVTGSNWLAAATESGYRLKTDISRSSTPLPPPPPPQPPLPYPHSPYPPTPPPKPTELTDAPNFSRMMRTCRYSASMWCACSVHVLCVVCVSRAYCVFRVVCVHYASPVLSAYRHNNVLDINYIYTSHILCRLVNCVFDV